MFVCGGKRSGYICIRLKIRNEPLLKIGGSKFTILFNIQMSMRCSLVTFKITNLKVIKNKTMNTYMA